LPLSWSCGLAGVCAQTLDVPLHSLGGQVQVAVAYDVVPIKDGAGLVAADLHGDLLGNPCTHHVPDGGASEVVEEVARNPGCPAFRRSRIRAAGLWCVAKG